MSDVIPGGCQCGEVRYELRGVPLTSYACHCKGCQRSSGSDYTLSLLANAADLHTIAGQVHESSFQAESGPRTWHGCERCRCSLWYTSPTAPEFVAIKSGTLDNPTPFAPVAHLWTQHTQPHVQLPAQATRFEQQPEAMLELFELWAQR